MSTGVLLMKLPNTSARGYAELGFGVLCCYSVICFFPFKTPHRPARLSPRTGTETSRRLQRRNLRAALPRPGQNMVLFGYKETRRTIRRTGPYAHHSSIRTAQSNLTWASGEGRAERPIRAQERPWSGRAGKAGKAGPHRRLVAAY